LFHVEHLARHLVGCCSAAKGHLLACFAGCSRFALLVELDFRRHRLEYEPLF